MEIIQRIYQFDPRSYGIPALMRNNLPKNYYDYRNNLVQPHLPDQVPPIPEEDLRLLERLYHGYYKDLGRKKGALKRYIKDIRENHEPPSHTKTLIKKLLR